MTTKKSISLSTELQQDAAIQGISFWLVGMTPLICHAWSEKARREMLAKQVKATRGGKEARNPEADFLASLYNIGDGVYGFPASAVKKSIVSAGHKDKGIPKTALQSALWIRPDLAQTRPALAGAVCDMPILRLYGSEPQMREDMVRVGAGLNKTATLAYRAQFSVWAIRVEGSLNTSVVPISALTQMVLAAGREVGIGDWRNERGGMFGSFTIGNAAEETAWEKFAAGKGKLPVPASMKIAAE